MTVERAQPDPQLVPVSEISGLRQGNDQAMTAPGSPSLAVPPGSPASHPDIDDVSPGVDRRKIAGGPDDLPSNGWEPAHSGPWND